MKTLADSGELEEICKKIIDDNAKAVGQYKSGEEKALNFLIGKVMRETKGTAGPQEVRESLIKLIS